MVLDAAHLYSYAKLGKHQEHGGLLIRRDLHRLFDIGGLAVEPDSLVVDVRSDILGYASYSELHGQRLRVAIHTKTRAWLKKHWKAHRT